MNRRFLRWVLDVTHKSENNYSRTSISYFFWAERAIRWNMLMCAVVFSLCVLLMLFRKPADWSDRLLLIAFGGFVVYLWPLYFNMRFFNKMRQKKRIADARRATRWMLKATPFVFVGWIVISLFIFLGFMQSTGEHNLVFLYLLMCLIFPYAFTRFWVTIATTPFHAGFGKR